MSANATEPQNDKPVSERLLWQVEKLAPTFEKMSIEDHAIVLAILAQLFDARRTAEQKMMQEKQASEMRQRALAIK